MKTFALITGASSGLGKAFAQKLASKKRNLILISLPNEGLRTYSKTLEDLYGVDIITFEIDLTEKNDLFDVLRLINANYQLDILINNAGFGGTKKMESTNFSYLDQMIDLNIKSTTFLTRALLTNLGKMDKAYILNISSMAAHSPMPFKTIYPATKSFISSFSIGLHEELKGSGVSVSVAYPGGMPTNKQIAKRINKHKGFIKKTILNPEDVAEICLYKMFNRKMTIIPGFWNVISFYIFKLIPTSLRLSLMSNNLQKELV
jgi:short-subunit dehydrogenase